MKTSHRESGTSFSRALLRRQGNLLRRYMEQTVLPFSKHYARSTGDLRRIRRVEDLRHIPFTIKRDVQDQSLGFYSCSRPEVLARRPSTILRALRRGRQAVEEAFEHEFRPSFMTFTTGRSAQPLPFLYTGHDLQHLQTAGDLIMRICGAKRDMKMLNMFPYAPHLAFWLSHYAGTEFGVLMVSSGGGKVAGTEGNLRFIRKACARGAHRDADLHLPRFAGGNQPQPSLSAALENHSRRRKSADGNAPQTQGPRGATRRRPGRRADDLRLHRSQNGVARMPLSRGRRRRADFIFIPILALLKSSIPRPANRWAKAGPARSCLRRSTRAARSFSVIAPATWSMADSSTSRAPIAGGTCPGWWARISRTSEVREMNLDKLKGTLVDFNQLEHVLDNFESIGAWQMELRKAHDDPLELDELILHVEKIDNCDEARLRHGIERTDRLRDRDASEPDRLSVGRGNAGLQGVGVQTEGTTPGRSPPQARCGAAPVPMEAKTGVHP